MSNELKPRSVAGLFCFMNLAQVLLSSSVASHTCAFGKLFGNESSWLVSNCFLPKFGIRMYDKAIFISGMTNCSKTLNKGVWLCMSLLLFSCEGFKFIAVDNKTKDNITIIIRPGVETPELVEQPKTYQSRVDTVLTIPPDSILFIPNYFGPLFIFNEKIREKEIKYHYLKIVSKTDTIIAHNKAEIFKLLDRKRNVGRITVN
jgi:hypothetical protein